MKRDPSKWYYNRATGNSTRYIAPHAQLAVWPFYANEEEWQCRATLGDDVVFGRAESKKAAKAMAERLYKVLVEDARRWVWLKSIGRLGRGDGW